MSPIVPAGRFNDYIDLGQREFNLKFVTEKEGLDRQAQLFNEGVRALSFFPSGKGEIPEGMLEVKEPQMLLTAITGNAQDGYLFRLYNAGEENCNATVTWQGRYYSVPFGRFEVKRLRLQGGQLTVEERIG